MRLVCLSVILLSSCGNIDNPDPGSVLYLLIQIGSEKEKPRM